MKLSRKEDGTLVADFQGLDGSRLQLTVTNFLEKLKKGERAEIIVDDPDTHEPILMALRKKGYGILQNTAEGGTFRIRVKK
jgi:TusA-related sulfurtransferase